MKELFLAVILLLLLSSFVLFEELLMPMETTIILSLGLILSFFFYTIFIWKEKGRDEREILHALHAGRVSFLTGSFILVLGIVVQAFNHSIDPWLIYALSGIVFSKLMMLLYQNYKK
jgi:hypothetical protein